MTIPFAYAEAGHLTWGYATTLHKAQGATFDQTFLLADETLHRERSYSGLSRGVEANDLYVAVPEDDEHYSVQQDDDLIERVRQTVNRSDAKTLALDDLRSGDAPATTPIDQLRAKRLRRRLAPILNRSPRPHDELAALNHGHETSRLRQVDSLIADHHRQHQPSLGPEQDITRSVERDVGIDLGL